MMAFRAVRHAGPPRRTPRRMPQGAALVAVAALALASPAAAADDVVAMSAAHAAAPEIPAPGTPTMTTADRPAQQIVARAAKRDSAPAAGRPADGVHWGYEGEAGPDRWSTLQPNYTVCGQGQRQSPIDVDGAAAAHLAPLSIHYKVTTVDLVNNGHTVQANYARGSYITVGDDRFDLVQFHFHTPSEHRIGGNRFPMEIHFVHRNAVGQLAVLGVLVVAGEESLAAREIWTHLPRTAQARALDPKVLINGRDLLPEDRGYFRYSGSLTTPPCTEDVRWLVLQTPVRFSSAQIRTLSAIMGANSRPVQARNGRFLLHATGG